MKPTIDIKSLLMGAVLATALVMSMAAAADRGTAWEYKVVTGSVFGGDTKLETVINSHVEQGWQFVATSGFGERSGYALMRRDRE